MMKYTPQKRNSESGMALVFAIGLLALLLMIGMAFVGNAVNYRQVAENNSSRSRSRMFALSAVSRAASSLMIYAHQYAKSDPNKKFPESFDGIYSFAAYDNDGNAAAGGANEYNDALKGADSVLQAPANSSVISARTAVRFNQQFCNDWPGRWVFFTNGKQDPASGETSRRLIGRAAWQVIGSPAQLLAPVFMRGHLALDKAANDGDVFVPSENRWGREIDEVFLGDFSGVSDAWNPAHVLFTNVATQLQTTASTMMDYQNIYNVTSTPGTAETQRWVEKWFIPDFEKNKTVADPSRIAAETYADGGDSLLRFNISELGEYNTSDWNAGNTGENGWREAYDVDNNADQWYARLGIDTTVAGESGKVNSFESIKLLTQDSLLYEGGITDDGEYAKDGDTNGLPVLRRIGNDKGTFTDVGTLRKQIAANFNDYCDADGIPTSDVEAKKWLDVPVADAGGVLTYTHPTFTGNEKTPYLCEIGALFKITGAGTDGEAQLTLDDTVSPDANGTLTTPVNGNNFLLNIAPMVKLANIYPFDASDGGYSDVQAMVDFGALSARMEITVIKLKNIKFEYDVSEQKTDASGKKVVDADGNPEMEDVTKTGTVGELKITLNSFSTVGATDLSALKGQILSASLNDGELAHTAGSEAYVDFPGDELGNTDGAKPYPFSFAKDKWQKNESGKVSLKTYNSTGDTDIAELKIGVDILDKVDSGNLPTDFASAKEGSKKITGVEAVIVDEIKVTHVSANPQRAVLSAKLTNKLNLPSGAAAGDRIGIDYVRLSGAGSAAREWNVDQTFTFGTDKTMAIALGTFCNYDPRQNLNPDDWEFDAKYAAVVNAADPTEVKGGAVMDVVDESGTLAGKVNKESGNMSFTPQNPFDPAGVNTGRNDCDEELATEPAYTGSGKDKHISTAVIRNAPMMSPWEIGFIHRGVKWQTINIKTAGYKDFASNEDNWDKEGSTYLQGDGAVFEQIKMTGKIHTYGKINVNLLRPAAPNYDSARDPEILAALFRNIRYGEDPAIFIANSTRQSDGKFPAENTAGSTLIDADHITTIKTNFAGSAKESNYSGKLGFLNYGTTYSLENAFHADIGNTQTTDAAQEEIIGKTINLICATSNTPSVINMMVVAQSIKDVAGTQVRLFDPDDKGDYTIPAGSGITVDDDGVATKECKYGKFDYLEHNSDPGKNIYFDEITGEVKMFVRLYINDKGRMVINRITYL